ncbi:MAG: hypothetical protein QOE25_1527 [Actinomycetota bacterium]|jgi:hypothetical protein|nr:hypothetical protein [Actinomycetota bacterium]
MRQDKIDYVGVLASVGGLLGFIGIYLGWWYYSWAVSGGTLTQEIRGLEDWSGVAALVAGIGAFAFGGAYLLMDDPGIRRLTGALMGISAIFLLGMTIVGMFRAGTVVGPSPLIAATPGTRVQINTGLSGGIFLSMVGGVVAVVATIMMIGRDNSPEASGAV